MLEGNLALSRRNLCEPLVSHATYHDTWELAFFVLASSCPEVTCRSSIGYAFSPIITQGTLRWASFIARCCSKYFFLDSAEVMHHIWTRIAYLNSRLFSVPFEFVVIGGTIADRLDGKHPSATFFFPIQMLGKNLDTLEMAGQLPELLRSQIVQVCTLKEIATIIHQASLPVPRKAKPSI